MNPPNPFRLVSILVALVAAIVNLPVRAAETSPIRIFRAAGPIVIDGVLDDEAWQQITPIGTWYEFRPGDNVEPKVRTRARLAYDDRYVYAAFDMDDPRPELIRAPLSDRDDLDDSTDHAGLIIDATDDGQTGQMFFANPRGIQYDAIMSDSAGEDAAPDWFWDSAARIDERGWTLEIRIPFASLRYADSNPERWRVLLYRNWPRDYQYEITSTPLPRESHCIVCNFQPLVGLESLPTGNHWVFAPYVAGSRISTPRSGLGSPLRAGAVDQETGFDAKWSPTPNTVIDATYNPDFSQIESDSAQITANERFAIFYPERRPFFLEGADLFSTQVPAVYTRSITQPVWGVRSTGEAGRNTYTILAVRDEGGGSVIIPGSRSSELARQDFESLVLIGRLRRDCDGGSYVSALFSGREIEGGGYNRVFGPDFRWQPSNRNVVSGQFLVSTTTTPDRPDLADEWDGRHLEGHVFDLWWQSRSPRWDSFLLVTDVSNGFRADNGFVPSVGARRGYWEAGRSWHPAARNVSFVRVFSVVERSEERDGGLLVRRFTPGIEMEGRWTSYGRLAMFVEESRGREKLFEVRRVSLDLGARPGRVVSTIGLSVRAGDMIDYANDRLGDGLVIGLETNLRSSTHLSVAVNAERQTLDVTTDDGRSGRLFAADVARVRSVWTFSARSWVRFVAQWVETRRDPDLYQYPVRGKEGGFATSAAFAYKLNWQTVLYAGWADNRTLDGRAELQPQERQFFVKMSYAIQR